ncbi:MULTISPECIES: transglutaminase-like domain-containing protein [unclassified Streptomyces]|uniref:transglutaminase-like domain-containing protein n=1 Tax=unclassified Streptomyces TaxID=2593676 RepID=UPI00225C067A|nr:MULTISPECIES: transglutaminase domain-containing protein [unclassified Streptomyces]MCX5060583.1 transglutaminase domain-containing protein [Streptomyces sp. NBC_00452]MCX5293827.1 transglutaminase domain-containing protein [Streptomyces sp. NBC_00183]
MSLDFHASHSTFSDPGDLARLYTDLPRDPAQLARISRNLLIHRLEGELFGHAHPTDRLHNDAETRYVDGILRILVGRNDAPLDRRREVGDRFVGICRDFSLLHCSLLRHAGVPARIRIGFADYWGSDGFHGDHVVTEYWDEGRGWLLADAQLADPFVTDHWKVDFDPMDVPRDRFLVAGEAWRAIRERGADPATFGLHGPEEGPFWGERYVSGSIRLDLAALNKVETLLWDVWGEAEGEPGEPLPEAARAFYDRVAPVVSGDVNLAAARRLFAEDDTLRTPRTVTSYAPFNGPNLVTLR